MKNTGKPAESAFAAHWLKIGHCVRLRDKKDLMGLNGGRNIADFAKPSDFIVSAGPDHQLHYAEVKSTEHKDGFAFGGIRPAQHNAAILEAKRGSGSYVFYIFTSHMGEWYTMDCVQYAKLIDEGRRSVKFKELTRWQPM